MTINNSDTIFYFKERYKANKYARVLYYLFVTIFMGFFVTVINAGIINKCQFIYPSQCYSNYSAGYVVSNCYSITHRQSISCTTISVDSTGYVLDCPSAIEQCNTFMGTTGSGTCPFHVPLLGPCVIFEPCGDGVVNAGEVCDKKNDPLCSSDCKTKYQCTSADLSNCQFGQYCSNNNCVGYCGDGNPNGKNEECDPPNVNYCQSNCTKNGRCGDGIIQSWGQEECDDSDTQGGDGCSATCKVELGCDCPTNSSGSPIAGNCSCGECQSSSECTDIAEPICENNECRPCAGLGDNSECNIKNNSKPICALDNKNAASVAGQCVECNDYNDCIPEKPVCSSEGLCTACSQDNQCSDKTGGYCCTQDRINNNKCTALGSCNDGYCGDSIIGLVELCDDGDQDSNDGCSSTCVIESDCTCPTDSQGNTIVGACTCPTTGGPPSTNTCASCVSETDTFTGQVQDPKPPTDVFFMLDVSSSVSNSDYSYFSDAVSALLDNFNFGTGINDDRYAVVQFSSTKILYDLNTQWHLTLNDGPNIKLTNGETNGVTSTMESSKTAYSSVRAIPGGATALADALKVYEKYIDHVAKRNAIKLLIIIHDMGDADDPDEITKAITEANKIKDTDKFIVSIRTMASSPTTDGFASPGVAFNVSDIDDLVATIQSTIIDEVLAEVYIKDEFVLTKNVDDNAVNNIKVYIEGTLLANSDWQYNSDTNSIKFVKKEFAPRQGEVLTVEFCSSCSECTIDNDCSTAAKPLCNASGLCLPCNDSTISNGQTRCSTKTVGTVCAINSGAQQGQCVTGNCIDNSQCSYTLPVCSNYNCTVCTADNDCSRFPNLQNCNTVTGACVDCVNNADCDSSEVCVNGICTTGNCLTDTDCPFGDPVCIGNTCSDCTTDSQCARFPNLPNCNTVTGACVDCVNDTDCQSGEVCVNGICTTGNCLTDTDCPFGDPVCIGNTCSDCTTDSQCARFPNLPNCNTVTGACVDCVNNADCDSSEVCVNGICTTGNCLTDTDCPFGDPVCIGNTCSDCTTDSQCARFPNLPNCNTVTGACVDCVNNADCDSSEVCVNGICTTGNCLTDTDCPFSDPVCIGNTCSDCTTDSQCARFPNLPNCNTVTGACVGCVNNADCPDDEVCTDSICVDGGCKSDDECADGEVCFNGRCVGIGQGNLSGIDCHKLSNGVFGPVLPELETNCSLDGINADEANYSYKLYCTKNHKTACSFCKKHLLQDINCIKACELGNSLVCTRCQRDQNTQGVCDLVECLYDKSGCNSSSIRKWSKNLTFPSCANGVIEYPEQCDDGNLINGDGCSDVCGFE